MAAANSIPLEIEKLVYGGDGLARLPADPKGRRMAVFVPFTLPGEKVEAASLQTRGGMARAELQAVIQASPQRVPPPCPYFGTCGGCHLQHGSYELQLQAKRHILQETFSRAKLGMPTAIETLAGEPWNYRNRIRLHVRTGPRWQVGYLERRSHRFLAVTQCPIASPLLQRAIIELAEPNVTLHAPQGLLEVELFCNQDSSKMTLTAFVSSAQPHLSATFQKWITALQHAVPELTGGVAVLRAPDEATNPPLATAGTPGLTYTVGGHAYQVAAGAFFQVNLHLLDRLKSLVTSSVLTHTAASVLDLYAGVGLFSMPLARSGARVTAVESAPPSSESLARNLLPFANAGTVRSTTEQFLASFKGSPDAIVVDPPRAGLGPQVTQQLARIAAPTLIYLSCDPTTLARDLQPLLASGYRAEQVTMIDLFPQTFHLETLVLLRHR